MRTTYTKFKPLGLALGFALIFGACSGRAKPLHYQSNLGAATIEGTGATRTDGANLGNIYPVTHITQASQNAAPSPIVGWTFNGGGGDYPFSGTPLLFGQFITDRQTPFYFSFTYPPNNYQLAEAHLVIDTQRDSSDTEAIFVDGVFSGRPPDAMVNLASPKVTYATYLMSSQALPGPPTKNLYYINWSLAHYKQLTINTFDLNLADLLTQTPLTAVDVLNDGMLPVVTGDDSPVYQAFLVRQGYTISKTALTCVNSPLQTFQNVFLHNDGNSIGQAAFTGNVAAPNVSWTAPPAQPRSVEFYYEAQLPRVNVANVTITTGSISMQVKRAVTGASAMVINGIGLSEAAFDRTQATSAVERWEDTPAIAAKWNAFVATIPATNTSTTVTLNLLNIFGSDTLKSLIAQGKLNLSFAGGLSVVFAQNATSARVLGAAPVGGPELNLVGNSFTELCDVPNDPTSPLQDGAPIPAGVGDTTSPLLNSIQATEITSSGAAIQWLSDEGSSSQVSYGIGAITTSSTLDTTMKTFHRVVLTGLQPYKFYYYQVHSADSNGNLTTSDIKTFRTLR